MSVALYFDVHIRAAITEGLRLREVDVLTQLGLDVPVGGASPMAGLGLGSIRLASQTAQRKKTPKNKINRSRQTTRLNGTGQFHLLIA